MKHILNRRSHIHLVFAVTIGSVMVAPAAPN